MMRNTPLGATDRDNALRSRPSPMSAARLRLLSGVGIAALVANAAPFGEALAQETISLSHEIVDGEDAGDPSPTQNSPWTIGGDLIVGSFSTGELTVRNGGAVNNADGSVGDGVGSNGSVTVTGDGSAWANSGDLSVGRSGTGELTVLDGGSVSNTYGAIGYLSDGNGSVTVTGSDSIWTNSGDLGVGYFGTGELTISDGGSVSNANGDIGRMDDSDGSVTVTGNGSTWTNAGNLIVGNSGAGELTVSDGGSISNAGDGYVGNLSDGNGSVTVTGVESDWTSGGQLNVGNFGAGELTVSAGGAVSNTYGYIGSRSTGDGGVTVTGAESDWTNSDGLFVGFEGTGELIVADEGSVSSNDYGYIGYFSNSSGRVTVTGNGSTLTFSDLLHVGSSGTGELTVSDGGRVVQSAGIEIAAYGNSTGALNIGSAAGDPAVAPGILETPSVSFGSGDGALVFNHTGADYAFAPSISGEGAINVYSGATRLTADSSGFSGTTTVDGGRLSVIGALGGDITVGAGGTLGGSGAVGTATVATGGTVAPGNSIGTLTVDGDFALDAGATLAVEIDNAGKADLLEVTNAAALADGALIHVTPETAGEDGSTYTDGARYTILTAGGGLTVDGDQTITDDFAYLDFTRDVDADAYHLIASLLTSDDGEDDPITSFCLEGMSVNQCQAGDAAFGLGEGEAVYDAVLGQGHAQAAPGLDSLSGEGFASAQGQLSNSGIATGTNVLNRVVQAFAALGSAQPLGYATTDDQRGAANGNAWVSPFGGFGHLEGDGNAAGLNARSGGVLLGSDMLHDDWLIGGFAGVGRTGISIPERDTTISSIDLSIGAYGGWSGETIGLAFGGAYTRHLASSTREVAILGETLEADYGANTLSVFGEINTTLDHGATSLVPFARLGLAHTITESFTETGGNAALSVDPDDYTQAVTELGIRAEHQFALDTTLATVSGGIGWRHAFGETPSSTNSFSGGDPFRVSGNPISADALVLNAGLDLDLTPDATFGLSYNGQIAGDAQDHQFNAKLSVRF